MNVESYAGRRRVSIEAHMVGKFPNLRTESLTELLKIELVCRLVVL